MASNSIIKGDNTQAFDRDCIEIEVQNPYLYAISKIIIVTNSGRCIPNKPFTDVNNFQRETITLKVNYNSEETTKLNQGANVVNLVAYDMQNRQYTCRQSLTFYAKNGVICKNEQ